MSRLSACLALLASGSLALSACASSKSAAPGEGSGKVAASTSASPVASTSPESVRVGPLTEVFATPLPADPAQARVVEGFREAWLQWDQASYDWRIDAPVTDYITGDALAHLRTAVNALKVSGVVPAGVDRFFKTSVTAVTADSAVVTTCDDASKFTSEIPSTGKIDPVMAPPPGQGYIFETWNMVPRQGHWAMTSFSIAIPPDPRTTPCQP